MVFEQSHFAPLQVKNIDIENRFRARCSSKIIIECLCFTIKRILVIINISPDVSESFSLLKKKILQIISEHR